MKKLLIIAIIQFCALITFAQEGFDNGYVINYKGDTIKGKIRDRKYYNDFESFQTIKFISDKYDKEKYSANELLGYVKNDTVVYQSLALGVEGKKRFVRKLEQGAVILFGDMEGVISETGKGNSVFGNTLYVNVTIGTYTQKRMGEYYLQKNNDPNSLMEWRDRDYKTTAAYFFKDNKELMKAIESDKFQFKDLQTIVHTYNEWKAAQ